MLNEPVLEDDYPVHAGYFYVVDDRVICSDIKGTVLHLKADVRSYYKLSASVVKRCDIQGRREQGVWLVERPPITPVITPVERTRTCWMLTLDFNAPEETKPRCEVHADSHKKAVKLFKDSVQAVRDGKQPELNNHLVHRAATCLRWEIVKVRSV